MTDSTEHANGPAGAGGDRRGRLEAVRQRCDQLSLDAFLCFSPANRRYLSGFTGTSGFVLITPGEAYFLTDSRYTEQAHEQCPEFTIVEHGDDVWSTLRDRFAATNLRRVGFEAGQVTVAWLEEARVKADAVDWVATRGLVEELRLVKDEQEIAAIRRAQDLTDRVFADILPLVRPGVCERDLAAELEYRLRRGGAEGAAFDFIVASGERSALPHGVAGLRRIGEDEFVTFDFGCIVDGYCSDMTRTVVVGEADEQMRLVYDLVLRAQQAGLEAVRPGRSGCAVDAVARRVIEEAGYGERFGHGLGHGLGLEIHEGPRLSRREDRILQPGMVVTVEPGVYIPGWGGVRIEDLVVVREHGAEVLTRTPKELLTLPASRT